MKSLLLGAIAALTLSSPVLARTISVPRADALDGNRVIHVWAEGGGLNLDLSQLNEQIVQITLDDLSQIGYYHCLLNRSCEGAVPPVIHLRRINKVEFDSVPSVNQTLLTVVTVDARNQWNTYQFPVSLGEGKATYNKVKVEPELELETVVAAAPAKPIRYIGREDNPDEQPTADSTDKVLERVDAIEEKLDAVLEKIKQTPDSETGSEVKEEEQPAQEQEQSEPEPIAPSNSPEIVLAESEPLEEPQESVVEEPERIIASVEPKIELPNRTVESPTVPTHTRYANAIARSLVGNVEPGSSESRRVNSAIAVLRRGGSLIAAADRSGVPMERLEELIGKGER